MKIQKINTGIIITKTAKQPSAKIEFSLDELDVLSEFCERLQDEKDIREYLNTAVAIPDSAEVSAPVAIKYLRDAALFEQLVDETRRNQEENQSDFLTAVSDAVSSIEKSRDVKEWHGLTRISQSVSLVNSWQNGILVVGLGLVRSLKVSALTHSIFPSTTFIQKATNPPFVCSLSV